MRGGCVVLIGIVVLCFSSGIFAQEGSVSSSANTKFWVNYWAQPRIALFGPAEEEFNKNLQIVYFPWDDHDEPSNPSDLESNAQWLKEHPNVRFYIDGYASSRGELIYNLALSQRRADWVRQQLINRGVDANRIKVAAGWGELYPVCPELTDECWSKNRLVRFEFAPN
jgi:outer membrane protein OmpA-like peptidoglycan-associated protein